MLVLSRRSNERILLHVEPSSEPQDIELTVVRIANGKVRLGILADPDVVKIARAELIERVEA